MTVHLPGLELRDPLGEGGWSVVWRAETAEGASRAVKVLAEQHRDRPQAVGRFLREGRLLQELGGCGFVHVHDVIADPVPALVMECLEGEDLELRVRRLGPQPAEQVGRWMQQVGRAVDALHARGLVHRDLKPGNLFLCADGRVVVLDLGLAKATDETDELLQTRAGMVLGTPLYMAPEQARGLAAIGPAADVWALGLVTVWALTGDRYWRGTSRAEIGAALFTMPFYRPSSRWPHLHPDFDRWFQRSCSRDPGERFASVREQMAALEDVLSGRGYEGGEWLTTDTLPLPPEARVRADLPRPRTSLLGRAADLDRIEAVVSDPGVGLVTVIGVGGTGKTHLVLEAAHRLRPQFTHGVYYASLAALAESDLFGAVLAEALGLHDGDRRSDLDRCIEALRDEQALVVLDNLEHLDVAGDLVQLLRRCPRLTVLATSRSALHLREEHRVVLQPLAVPPPRASDAEVAASPSVQLLVERVRAVRPDFAPEGAELAAVAELARRLDGLPLALELIAARMRLMSPSRVLARFGGQLTSVEGRAPDLPARQRTVRAALEGSVDLLSEEARRGLWGLSVFAGSVSLDAVEAVLGFEGAEAVEELLDHGLVRSLGGERFALMVPVREFAAEQLDRAGAEVVRDQFLGWAHGLAAAAAEGLDRGQDHWLEVLDREMEHLRAALALALAGGTGADLAGALTRYWYLRGHYAEGRRWLDRALDAEKAPTAARALALFGAGRLAFLQCDYGKARACLESSAALYAELGDPFGADRVLQSLGSVAREQGDYAASVARHEASRRFAEARGDELGVARADGYLCFALWLQGELDRARDHGERARPVLARHGDAEGQITIQVYLAATALYGGDLAVARQLAIEARDTALAVGFPEGAAWSRDVLALCELALGETEAATHAARRALRTHLQLGDLWRASSVVETLARLAGDDTVKAELLAGAEALRAKIGTPRPPVEQPAIQALEAHLAAALAPDQLAAARTRGAQLSPEALAQRALH